MDVHTMLAGLRWTIAVAAKELREAVRDRRSLMSGLFYGIWGPLVMAMALSAFARNQQTDTPITLTMTGAEHAAGLISHLADKPVTVLAEPASGADGAALVRERRRTVVVQVSEDFAPKVRAARSAPVSLIYDASWAESRRDADRVRAWLREYGAQVAETRLILRGVSPSVVMPLDVRDRDVSTAASRAATALATLPMFVLLATFVGGMSIAADVTAGERERGSLEALLVNPVSRLCLVLGKWLATSVVALATTALTLVVAHFVLSHPSIQAVDLPIGLPIADAVTMWLILAPLALAVVAIQLWVAIQAKTFKEAQTQLSLLMFVPMIPGFLLAFGSLEVSDLMRRLPIIGQHLLITDIVRGLPVEAITVFRVTLLTAVTAGTAIWASARTLSRERTARVS